VTLKVTQGLQNCRYSTGHTGLSLFVVCSNNVSFLHRFRDYHIYSVLPVTLRSPPAVSTRRLKLLPTRTLRFMRKHTRCFPRCGPTLYTTVPRNQLHLPALRLTPLFCFSINRLRVHCSMLGRIVDFQEIWGCFDWK